MLTSHGRFLQRLVRSGSGRLRSGREQLRDGADRLRATFAEYKARADAQKLDANVGLLTRVERYIVLIPGLIFSGLYPPLALIALTIIAIFANITALQRIFRARQDAYRRLSQSQE